MELVYISLKIHVFQNYSFLGDSIKLPNNHQTWCYCYKDLNIFTTDKWYKFDICKNDRKHKKKSFNLIFKVKGTEKWILPSSLLAFQQQIDYQRIIPPQWRIPLCPVTHNLSPHCLCVVFSSSKYQTMFSFPQLSPAYYELGFCGLKPHPQYGLSMIARSTMQRLNFNWLLSGRLARNYDLLGFATVTCMKAGLGLSTVFCSTEKSASFLLWHFN